MALIFPADSEPVKLTMNPKRTIGILLLALLCFQKQSVSIGQDEYSQEFKDTLVELKLDPSRQGLQKYFLMYRPDASNSDRVKRLIAELGSVDFSVRSQATLQLANVSHTDIPLIRQATESSDLEISLRAKQVLKMFEKGTHLKRLQKVLVAMAKHNVDGFVPELCIALSVVQPQGGLLRQFQKTLEVTTRPTDAVYLMEQVQTPSQFGRDLILNALCQQDGAKHIELLASLVTADDSEQVRLAAAMRLADQLDRRSLKPLVALLESELVTVRSSANRTLKNITGQKFKFFASAKEEQRLVAIQKWQDWLRDKGNEATLFKSNRSSVEFMNRLIVSSYTKKKVYEADMEGNVLRTINDVGAPMGVFGSEDGRILICDYSGRKIRVYDSESKEIFSKVLPAAPLAAEFLENGNILVGTTNAKQVLELDPEGETVWKATVSGRINVVHRTFEGTTLVSMLGEGKVVELDESGKIIFELAISKPNGVRRLENGNTLVCVYNEGEVREYDPNKNVVWKVTGLKSPARAQRLPDGSTLVRHSEGIFLFDEAGKQVREIKSDRMTTGGTGSVHYF